MTDKTSRREFLKTNGALGLGAVLGSAALTSGLAPAQASEERVRQSPLEKVRIGVIGLTTETLLTETHPSISKSVIARPAAPVCKNLAGYLRSIGIDEETYGRIHVDFPVRFVTEWLDVSDRDEKSFHYISSSDISADSSMMWAREKVRAEKTLFAFAQGTKMRVIAYRPDYIGPTREDAHIGQDLLYWFFAPVGAAVRARRSCWRPRSWWWARAASDRRSPLRPARPPDDRAPRQRR